MKAVLWVVEVRDSRDESWQLRDFARSRAEARVYRADARSWWRFTRIVKYVREAA